MKNISLSALAILAIINVSSCTTVEQKEASPPMIIREQTTVNQPAPIIVSPPVTPRINTETETETRTTRNY